MPKFPANAVFTWLSTRLAESDHASVSSYSDSLMNEAHDYNQLRYGVNKHQDMVCY